MAARADAGSARVSKRELAILVSAACALAIAAHFGLVADITTDVAQELRDPLLQTWQIAWDGHAMAGVDGSFFDANIFFPLQRTLAFSDALIGYGPTALLGGGPEVALVRYNLWFLFAYAFAFIGAYLLARELGLGPFAATAAGLAFAYAPWRLDQMRHLHVISSGGIPLSLFLLVRGYRWHRPNAVLGGWLLVAWQISLGFTLGLQLGYLLVLIAISAVAWWFRRGRPHLDRATLLASIVGVLVLALWGIFQARPYLEVAAELPEAPRTIEDVKYFSPEPWSFLAAPEESFLWGEVSSEARMHLNWPQEQILFPGAVIAALSVFGVLGSTFPRALKLGLLAGIVVTGVLSLGMGWEDGRFGYRFLYDHLPGWDGIRTPGRLTTLTTLGLGLLGGAGLQWLFPTDDKSTGRRLSLTMSVLLVCLVLVEGLGRVEHHTVPEMPPELASVGGPRFHLPSNDYHDAVYMLWSTEDFTPIVNGVSGFLPQKLAQLREDMEEFPEPAMVTRLRSMGVRFVVLHPDLASGTAWEDLGRVSIRAPGVVKRERGDLVIYEIEP